MMPFREKMNTFNDLVCRVCSFHFVLFFLLSDENVKIMTIIQTTYSILRSLGSIVSIWNVKCQIDSHTLKESVKKKQPTERSNKRNQKVSFLRIHHSQWTVWTILPYVAQIFGAAHWWNVEKRCTLLKNFMYTPFNTLTHNVYIHIHKIWSSLLTFCVYATERVQSEQKKKHRPERSNQNGIEI